MPTGRRPLQPGLKRPDTCPPAAGHFPPGTKPLYTTPTGRSPVQPHPDTCPNFFFSGTQALGINQTRKTYDKGKMFNVREIWKAIR